MKLCYLVSGKRSTPKSKEQDNLKVKVVSKRLPPCPALFLAPAKKKPT